MYITINWLRPPCVNRHNKETKDPTYEPLREGSCVFFEQEIDEDKGDINLLRT